MKPVLFKIWETFDDMNSHYENNMPQFDKNYFHVKIHYEINDDTCYVRDKSGGSMILMSDEIILFSGLEVDHCYIVEYNKGKLVKICYDTTDHILLR